MTMKQRRELGEGKIVYDVTQGLASSPSLIHLDFDSKRTGADAIKKFTPSLGIPYLGV